MLRSVRKDAMNKNIVTFGMLSPPNLETIKLKDQLIVIHVRDRMNLSFVVMKVNVATTRNLSAENTQEDGKILIFWMFIQILISLMTSSNYSLTLIIMHHADISNSNSSIKLRSSLQIIKGESLMVMNVLLFLS